MKEIKAYVRVFMVANVIKALKHENVHAVTAIDVSAISTPLWRDEKSLSPELGVHTHMIKLEIVCRDDEVENIVKTIRANAHTGNKGDGIISVSDIEHCMNIRTGKCNQEAVEKCGDKSE